ncbi:hypothetical protein GQ53DRAFT_861664 [Thozetella sp. PMI_491]|nr:hypothetical protein GQ53DRAFT_861664 [Thozetella sp. PMI_491]
MDCNSSTTLLVSPGSGFPTAPTGRLGWVASPGQRGTIDIIYACLLMLFVSVWTILHPNIPAKDDSYRRVVMSKIIWAFLGIFSPEMVASFAAAQWKEARKDVRDMAELRVEGWTMAHAYYANSGGFLLSSPDYPPFPVNSKSIYYLYKNGWITLPDISQEDIWDRSKSDIFTKVFALMQIVWLLLQTLVRAAQGLAITPLEMFTVAFIPPTILTAFFWASKPQNVNRAIAIPMQRPVAEVLRTADDSAARRPWDDTPLDFIEKPVFEGWYRRPSLRQFGGLHRRPLGRIPNDHTGPPSSQQAFILWIASMIHTGLHIAFWSFPFATTIEVITWRAASVTLMAAMVAGGLVPGMAKHPGFTFHCTLMWVWVKKARVENPSWVERNLIDIIANVALATYVAARLVILILICAAFRSLPATAYLNANWSAFMPHVG